MRAIASVRRGRYEEAVERYDRALQIKPDYAYVHAQLGRALQSMQRPQQAVDSLSRAFRMQPELREHHVYQVAFAKALGDVGKTEEALAAYRNAAKLDPKDAEALAGIGWALSETGHNEDAEEPLLLAIKLSPDYAYSYSCLADVLQELNRYEDSIPFAERFVVLVPDDADGHVRLGRGLGMAGRFRDAVLASRRALELKPDDGAALYQIGLFHYEAGDYPEAIEALEKSMRLQPHSSAEAHSVIAMARMMLGDLPGAIRAGEEAVKLNPELPETWHNLGQTYLETGQLEKAVASLEKVFQCGPGNPDAHYLLGLAQFKLGNKAAALGQCHALEKVDSGKAQELRAVLSGEQS
jgi:tetratricopeptide (TPR) repeat protein